MDEPLEPEEFFGGPLPTVRSTTLVTATGQPACGARSVSGKPCMMPAGYGTDHPGYGSCKHHYGATKAAGIRAAREQVADIVKTKKQLGEIAPDADPEEVLLEEVRRAQAAVEFFDEIVKELGSDTVQSAQGRIAIDQWNEQRRMLKEITKTVLAAGIAERQTRVLEVQTAGVMNAVIGVLSSPEMKLTPLQQAMFRRMLAHSLRQIVSQEQRPGLEASING